MSKRKEMERNMEMTMKLTMKTINENKIRELNITQTKKKTNEDKTRTRDDVSDSNA